MNAGRISGDSTGDITAGVPPHPICQDGDTHVRREGQTVLVPAPDPSGMTQTDDGEMMGQMEGMIAVWDEQANAQGRLIRLAAATVSHCIREHGTPVSPRVTIFLRRPACPCPSAVRGSSHFPASGQLGPASGSGREGVLST
jgi:hypothetical protein